MSVNIMLSFLSNYHLSNGRPAETSYYGDGGYVIRGEHTNEAALRYVYEKYGLDKYFCFCSRMVSTEVEYVDDGNVSKKISHCDIFKERVGRYIPAIADIMELVDYTEPELSDKSVQRKDCSDADTAADLDAVKQMVNAITGFANPYLEAGTEVVLYVDTTGGFRHANTLMLAVVELLKYSGVTIGNVLYSNYNRENFDANGRRVPIGKIENITDIHGVVQLVAGAEAFVSYGSADVLIKYFDKPSRALSKLLNAMADFSDALSLCRSGMLPGATERLFKALKNFRESSSKPLQEMLFHELLLQRIEKEYSMLGDGGNRLTIIRWCLKKGFLQQALTFYTEWVPELIVDNRIIYTEKTDVERHCNENKFNYVSVAKYMLTSHNGIKTVKAGSSQTSFALYRKSIISKLIDSGELRYGKDKAKALDAVYQYNDICSLRNHINHANKEVIEADKLKLKLDKYLNALEELIGK